VCGVRVMLQPTRRRVGLKEDGRGTVLKRNQRNRAKLAERVWGEVRRNGTDGLRVAAHFLHLQYGLTKPGWRTNHVVCPRNPLETPWASDLPFLYFRFETQ